MHDHKVVQRRTYRDKVWWKIRNQEGGAFRICLQSSVNRSVHVLQFPMQVCSFPKMTGCAAYRIFGASETGASQMDFKAFLNLVRRQANTVGDLTAALGQIDIEGAEAAAEALEAERRRILLDGSDKQLCM